MGMISVCSNRELYFWSIDVLALLIETCHVPYNGINPRWCFYSWTWHVGRSTCESDRLKKYWHSINRLRKLTRSIKRLCRGFSPGVPHHRKQKSNQSWSEQNHFHSKERWEFWPHHKTWCLWQDANMRRYCWIFCLYWKIICNLLISDSSLSSRRWWQLIAAHVLSLSVLFCCE